MRKSRLFYLLLLCLVIFFSLYYIIMHVHRESPETTLLKAFKTSGATVVNSEIYFWSELGKKYGDVEKARQLGMDIVNAMGGAGKNSLSDRVTVDNNIKKLEITAITKDNGTVNIKAQFDNTEGQGQGRYISVNVAKELAADGLEEVKKAVLAVFDKYGIKPSVNSCITGSFAGEMNHKQLGTLCSKVLKGAKAKKVEGMEEANLLSISAYSPSISNVIKVNGKEMNLNLAVRYNSYERKTYIWLATPIITTEY